MQTTGDQGKHHPTHDVRLPSHTQQPLLPEALTAIEVGIEDFFANGKEWLTAFVNDPDSIVTGAVMIEGSGAGRARFGRLRLPLALSLGARVFSSPGRGVF